MLIVYKCLLDVTADDTTTLEGGVKERGSDEETGSKTPNPEEGATVEGGKTDDNARESGDTVPLEGLVSKNPQDHVADVTNGSGVEDTTEKTGQPPDVDSTEKVFGDYQPPIDHEDKDDTQNITLPSDTEQALKHDAIPQNELAGETQSKETEEQIEKPTFKPNESNNVDYNAGERTDRTEQQATDEPTSEQLGPTDEVTQNTTSKTDGGDDVGGVSTAKPDQHQDGQRIEEQTTFGTAADEGL